MPRERRLTVSALLALYGWPLRGFTVYPATFFSLRRPPSWIFRYALR